MDKKRNPLKILFFRSLPPVGWMVLIFCFSNQNAEASSLASGKVAKLIGSIVVRGFKNLTPEMQEEFVENIIFWVRKGAHMGLYFILFLLVFQAVCAWIKNFQLKTDSFMMSDSAVMRNRYIISIGIVAAYSITDELHQYFIPGRSCELRDVLVDSAGAFIALIIVFAAEKINNRLKILSVK